MKTIPLLAKDGPIRARALVDDADFDSLSPYRWGMLSDGYPCRWERRGGRSAPLRAILLHRFILPAPDGMTVDHINRNRLDARRSNLRVVTQAVNAQNRGATALSATGHPGVFPRGSGYRVVFKHHGVAHRAGQFKSLERAVLASEILRAEVLSECPNAECKVPSLRVLHEVTIHGERVES